VRAAEPPLGPLGWAWCPGHRLGAATRPSRVDLLQIVFLFFCFFCSFGLFGPSVTSCVGFGMSSRWAILCERPVCVSS